MRDSPDILLKSSNLGFVLAQVDECMIQQSPSSLQSLEQYFVRPSMRVTIDVLAIPQRRSLEVGVRSMYIAIANHAWPYIL